MKELTLRLPIILPQKNSECNLCIEKLLSIVSDMKGIQKVGVDKDKALLSLTYDPMLFPLERIEEKIRRVGVEITERFRHESMRLTGLDCGDCAGKIEDVLSTVDGILWVSVNFTASRVYIEYDSEILRREDIVSKIEALGYGLEGEERVESLWKEKKRLITTIASGVFLALGISLSIAGVSKGLTIPLYLSSMLVGGYFILRSGLLAARYLSLDMNFLMTVAVVGAAIIGEWIEGATITFLFALAQVLEASSMEKARRAISSLMDISPKNALVLRNGIESSLPVEDIKVSDIIIIKPGEKIALDGRVIRGSSTVNQAPITGESMPVEKGSGDDVFAGTINQEGALYVEVTHTSKDTTIARIIHMVEEAQAQKAPSQAFVDRFARYYTPTVIGMAFLVASVPPLLFNQPFTEWFYRALVLLVISCPCALVISTPVSIVSALASAARAGVLIKGGVYLEEAGHLKAVVFDKTGTLTKGTPDVTDIVPLNSKDPKEILTIVSSVETRSEHPIARAILRKAEEEKVSFEAGEAFQSISGKGAWAKIDGRVFYAGNHRLFDEMGICTPEIEERIDGLEREGKTVILVGDDRVILGALALSDTVREEGKAAINGLRKRGIERQIMLTGDNRLTAEAVARRLGIDECRSELMPEDKVKAVEELIKGYGKVGMVGDGVNDAPALATASVGIAMGVVGSDVAMETADVALMSDDLSRLPFLISLSRQALRIIKANIAFSLLIKGIFIALALSGLATLWMAVGADMGASLLVIFNSLRLLKVQD